MKREEEIIQQQIVKHFWTLKNLNQFKIPCVLYSNRNENNAGGLKGIISGARYKAMGRLAGVLDLSLIYLCPVNGAKIAFIEVKKPSAHRTKSGKETKSKGLNEDQQDFVNKYIEPMKIPFTVVSSVKDFDNFIWFLK